MTATNRHMREMQAEVAAARDAYGRTGVVWHAVEGAADGLASDWRCRNGIDGRATRLTLKGGTITARRKLAEAVAKLLNAGGAEGGPEHVALIRGTSRPAAKPAAKAPAGVTGRGPGIGEAVPTTADEAEATFACAAMRCTMSGTACARRVARMASTGRGSPLDAYVDPRASACGNCAAGMARMRLLGIESQPRPPRDPHAAPRWRGAEQTEQ